MRYRLRFKAVSIAGAFAGDKEAWYVLDRAYSHRIVRSFPHLCADPRRSALALAYRLNAEHKAHLEELR